MQNITKRKNSGLIADLLKKEIIRFLLIGLTAAMLDVSILNFTKLLLGFSLVWSVSTGYIVGVITSYLLNSKHTFRSGRSTIKFIKFVAVNLLGLLYTNLVVIGFYSVGVHYNLAKVVAIVVVFCWNYLTYKYWVFKLR